jgi:hypothetical protein
VGGHAAAENQQGAAEKPGTQGRVSLREECDAAEVVRGALEDRRDMLRLLAVVGVGMGAKDLKTYEPPSVQLEQALAGDEVSRETEVTQFVMRAEG